MRVVWLDGAVVAAERAALSIDDPGVRWGEGLFETMRAEDGRVALLARHLDRLEGSAAALGLAPVPARREIERAVAAVAGALPPGPGRIRLTVTARPTLLVEGSPEPLLGAAPEAVGALTIPGAWHPGDRLAEHKSLSCARLRGAQRAAERAGAQHALLLDGAGRLGEAAVASAFCVVGGRVLTAPATGLLPGVARALVLEAMPVVQDACARDTWRAADEIVLTNALRGGMAVVEVDGAAVGDGSPGPVSRRIHDLLRSALSSPRRGVSASG